MAYACVGVFLLYRCVSQVVSLAVEGYGVHLHVDAAGLVAHHPPNRSAVEGGSRTNVMLVDHRWFWLLFSHFNIGQLEGHELRGLLKTSEWHSGSVEALELAQFTVYLWALHLHVHGGCQILIALHGLFPG